MLVCLCKGVSDHKIRGLMDSGIRTLREVMASSKAGSDCGSCICQLREMLGKDADQAEACDRDAAGA